MKKIVVYIFAFIIAFVSTTGLVYVLNDNFINIFKFDFNKKAKKISIAEKEKMSFENASIEEYTKKIISEIKNELIDSLSNFKNTGQDTVYKEIVKIVPDQKLLDSLETVSEAKEIAENNMAKKSKELEELREALGTNNKKEYNDWVAATVKLYEAMDSKRAAKIISNYSDNVARDIIYKMKNKKAAEILSNLNSEQIVKLTQAK